MHCLANASNELEKTDSIILDFSEMFNKASHRKLTIKVDHLRVLRNTLNWFAGFIQNHSQRPLVSRTTSSLVPLALAVLQKGVFIPLLLSLHITYLPLTISLSSNLFTDVGSLYKFFKKNK